MSQQTTYVTINGAPMTLRRGYNATYTKVPAGRPVSATIAYRPHGKPRAAREHITLTLTAAQYGDRVYEAMALTAHLGTRVRIIEEVQS